MKHLYIIGIIFFQVIFWSKAHGQVITKVVYIDSCIYSLDSQIIDPATFVIEPGVNFRIIGGVLHLDCDTTLSAFKPALFSVQYRTLSFSEHMTTTLFDPSRLEFQEKAIQVTIPSSKNESLPWVSGSDLQYNGSISRGFSVGNSQSLVLNSNLNLQLNGELGNGISVIAAISDENIPIQADGNTQLLQEFDKVFIKIQKNKTAVTAGDYDLRSNPQSRFMRYYKKLKGLRVDHQTDVNIGQLTANANIAISRGKFARQTLEVREGNQGPYKLRGNNGERFLIVLQGSERVYYDGVLLTRGRDYDYIIDYNNAEIIFTQDRLIRRESRIIVEYEYTDQNYLRSLYGINLDYRQKNYDLYFNFYNEQDSKNVAGQLELDSVDLAILASGEGEPEDLFRTGIREIGPEDITSNTILYRLEIDPITGDSVLVFTPDPVGDVFTAFFSEVTPGTGDYRIASGVGINGRIYEYVGKGKGSYLPIIQLIAPEKRQLMTAGGVYRLGNKILIKGESSFSNFDENRLSPFDNVLNRGFATFASAEFQSDPLNSDQLQPIWKSSYEYLGGEYRFLNPFRNQEFNRDWNISELSKSQEKLFKTELGYGKKSIGGQYEFSSYQRANSYQGYRHLPSLWYNNKNTTFSSTINYLHTKGTLENTQFLRPTIEWKQQLPFLNNWSIIGKYFAEENERIDAASEQLRTTSFSFSESSVSISSPLSESKRASFLFKRRRDDLPFNNALVTSAIVDEVGINGILNYQKSGLRWNITYRSFRAQEASNIDQEDAKTILGRVDFNTELFNGFIQSSSSFNLGSGQEARREFQFIKVEKGEGNYLYLGDLNGDGEDQINEYEIAVFSDQADFVRVSIVNNEFIRTENQGINQSLRISPQKLWDRNATGIRSILGRFSLNSIIRLDQKQMADGTTQGSFFHFDAGDSTTVSYNALVNNILFFNRGNSTYDVQLGNRYLRNRFVQITGYEDRLQNEFFIKTRINPSKSLDILTELLWGDDGYDSEFFDNKDLDVDYVEINPRIVYRPNVKWRLTGSYGWIDRLQTINEEEKARSQELSLEVTWRQAATSSLSSSFAFVDVSYEGQQNTPVSYSLLEGLSKGNNFLWNIELTRRIAGNVDLLISYNGRKTGDVATVHIGRAQVRANF